MMAEQNRCGSIEELPLHLIMEILSSGRLGAADLACLETSCRMFRGSHDMFPHKFRSMVKFDAFTLCSAQPVFTSLPPSTQRELLDRCDGNRKKVLRFLQSVEQSSGTVATSAGCNWEIPHSVNP